MCVVYSSKSLRLTIQVKKAKGLGYITLFQTKNEETNWSLIEISFVNLMGRRISIIIPLVTPWFRIVSYCRQVLQMNTFFVVISTTYIKEVLI